MSAPADWKEKLQGIIELSREQTQRLEAAAARTADCAPPCVDDLRQSIESEKRIIAKLQKTIDALTQ